MCATCGERQDRPPVGHFPGMQIDDFPDGQPAVSRARHGARIFPWRNRWPVGAPPPVSSAWGTPSDVRAATDPRSRRTSSCTKLVEQVMQNLDLVRDGRLVVHVQVTDTDGTAVSGPTIPKGSSMQCGVVTSGGQMLRGSSAIGTAPIPSA